MDLGLAFGLNAGPPHRAHGREFNGKRLHHCLRATLQVVCFETELRKPNCHKIGYGRQICLAFTGCSEERL